MSSDNEDDEPAEWFVYNQDMSQDEIPAGLTHVLVEAGTTHISDHAFDNVDDDTDGKYDGLQHVKMASSVTHIGEEAFHGCSSLVKVEFPPDSHLEEMAENAFNSTGLKEISLPASLRSMGHGCFEGCELLAKVTVSGKSRLEEVGTSCFGDCTSLKAIDLRHCNLFTEMPTFMFDSCESLQSIHLPLRLEAIHDCSFRHCTSLKTLSFPPTLATISRGVFERCKKLRSIQFQSMQVLAPVLQVHISAFWLCTDLCEIVLPQEDDETVVTKWPQLLPRLFWENGGLLGDSSTEEQQLSIIFSFLRPRMNKFVEDL